MFRVDLMIRVPWISWLGYLDAIWYAISGNDYYH
jgi:hypothetical protein